METQNQIKRKLSQPEAIEFVIDLIKASKYKNFSELTKEVCRHFSFYNFQGDIQLSGCMKALRELERRGEFTLPVSRRKIKKKSPRRLDCPVPEPSELPSAVGKIYDLRLNLVETEAEIRIWNELMIQDHPRGAGPLVGRQIRYLVQSEHGWLGGFAFSSSALQMEARDKWIGWDLETRRNNLQYVVNMSRFLIRSSVCCQNLASRLLGMVVRQFPEDYLCRYGCRPFLLESFVDTQHYSGTCYRAANWEWIGKTKGRGRQDRQKESKESIKDIYVYPFSNNFRQKLGVPEGDGLGSIDIYSDREALNWAEKEFGGAPIGDDRLTARLVDIGADKYKQPGISYARVVNGDKAKTKGYYRMIDKPANSAMTMSNILEPHRQQTIRRMKANPLVLCVQDGTSLNYNDLYQCEGLGDISKNQTGAKCKGLHLHSMIAITPDGLPLGVLHTDCSAPAQKKKKDQSRKKENRIEYTPIEEKKTFHWIEGLRECMDMKRQMPHTSLINVMDREADFFELFDIHREQYSKIDLLIRAKCDRRTSGPYKLFETARKSKIRAQLSIKIPRQSARPKKSKQQARNKREERIAVVSFRYKSVILNPPSHLRKKQPVKLWIINVREDNPPPGVDRLEWFLLTSFHLKSVKGAIECVKWYSLRWRIEDWHRVLKSGCGVEKIAHKTADRLKRVIAVNLVVAWRIMLMTLLGREAPELPPNVLFSNLELRVLKAYAIKKN